MSTCGDFFNQTDDCEGEIKLLNSKECVGECSKEECCPSTCEQWNINDDKCVGETTIDEHKCTDESPCNEDNCCGGSEETSDFKIALFVVLIVLAIALLVFISKKAYDKKNVAYLVTYIGTIGYLVSILIYDKNELFFKNSSSLLTILGSLIFALLSLQFITLLGFVDNSELPSILKPIILNSKDDKSPKKFIYTIFIIIILVVIGKFYSIIYNIIKEKEIDDDKKPEETTDTMKNINNYFTKNKYDKVINIIYVFILLIICIGIKNKSTLGKPVKGILLILLLFIIIFKIISGYKDVGFLFISSITTSILLMAIIIYTLIPQGKDVNIKEYIIPLLIFEIIVFILFKNFYGIFDKKDEKDADYETREISIIKVICFSLIITLILKSIKQLDKNLDNKKTILLFIILTIFLLGVTSGKWYERTDIEKDKNECAYDDSLINYYNNRQIDIDLQLRTNVFIDDNILFFIIITIIFGFVLKDSDEIKDIGIFILFIVVYVLFYFVGYLIKDEKITKFGKSDAEIRETCNEGIFSNCNSVDDTKIYKRNKHGLLNCGSLSITDYYIRRISGISIKDIRNDDNTKYSAFQGIKILIRSLVFIGILFLLFKTCKKMNDKMYQNLMILVIIIMAIIPLVGRIILDDCPLNDNSGDNTDTNNYKNEIKNNVYYETIRDYMSYIFKNPFSRAFRGKEDIIDENDDKDGINTKRKNSNANFFNDYGGLMILLIMIITLVVKIVFKLF